MAGRAGGWVPVREDGWVAAWVDGREPTRPGGRTGGWPFVHPGGWEVARVDGWVAIYIHSKMPKTESRLTHRMVRHNLNR